MNGRLDKVVSMFNALSDSDKEYVLTEIDYPEPPPAPDDPGFPPPPAEPMIPGRPEIETPYEVANQSFTERYAP